MRIIPVIDLLDGRAVHARGGERRLYRPLSTPLCRDPDPSAVAKAYLSLYPFSTIYLADLNAIQNLGDNRAAIGALRERFPDCEFWLDAGNASMACAASRLRPVIGTETGITPGDLGRLAARPEAPVLSLDFGAGGFLGDAAILGRPEDWPADIIVMSLPNVGSRGGPDFEQITRLRKLAPHGHFYAGGGLRGLEDLRQLGAAGAAGVLTATALHEGTITASMLTGLEADKKKPRPGPGLVVG